MTEEDQVKRANLLYDRVEEALNYIYPEKHGDQILSEVIDDLKSEFVRKFEYLDEQVLEYKRGLEASSELEDARKEYYTPGFMKTIDDITGLSNF